MVFGVGDTEGYSSIYNVSRFVANTTMTDQVQGQTVFLSWLDVHKIDKDFTLSEDGLDLVCNFDGAIVKYFDAMVDASNNRVEVNGWMFHEGAKVNRSFCSNYAARDGNQDNGQCHLINFWYPVKRGEKIRTQISTIIDGTTTATIVPDGTRIHVERVR